MKYQHLFFDLDHTLWDFETNSKEALVELYEAYNWESVLAVPVENFLSKYYEVNDKMWALYRLGKIKKAELRHRRFTESFGHFAAVDEQKVLRFEKDYIELAPRKTTLFPGCIEALDRLKSHFQMHIITNGFAETQHIKLRESALMPYFDQIITSDEIGVNKPEAGIFVEAMRRAGAERKGSLMIGDNLMVDILGARKVGMDQVFFNPYHEKHDQKLTFEIHHLLELPDVLGLSNS